MDALVDKFVHEQDEETQECACQAIYELAMNPVQSPIVQRLETEELINQLFSFIVTTVSHKQLTAPLLLLDIRDIGSTNCFSTTGGALSEHGNIKRLLATIHFHLLLHKHPHLLLLTCPQNRTVVRWLLAGFRS